MHTDSGARPDGRCRWGCRCSETLWHVVSACKQQELGTLRLRFYADYAKGVGHKSYDVSRVISVMKQRLDWGNDGRAQVLGAQSGAVECLLFGFVPEWLMMEVERWMDDEAIDSWLRRHGQFVKDWFWRVWKQFKKQE